MKSKPHHPPSPATGPSDKTQHRIIVVALFLLPLVFYWKYIFGSPMLYGTDWLGAGALAMREFMTRFIRSHGTIAYWMPAMLSGQPTGAAFFADLFYVPAALARLVLPIGVVWTWTFIIHMFIAGLGTYLFLKELKVGILPAGLGGVAYMFAGSLITLTYGGHDGRLIGSAFLPLALFFLHRGIDRQRFYYFLLTGLVIALQLLSGHLQKVYYTGLVLFAYLLFGAISAARREKTLRPALRLGLYFIVGIGTGVALSAIQYLPVWANMPYASRGAERGYEYSSSWSMPVIETLDLLTPKFSGGLHSYWGKNPFKLHSEYLGILPLLFAFIAVFRRWREKHVRFFTFTFLGTLLMAWGGNTPFYYLPYYLLPGVSKFRGPAMIFFAAACSLAVLAGLGLDYVLRQRKPEEAKPTRRTALVAAGIPLLLLLIFAALREPVLSLLRSFTLPAEQKAAALGANYPAMTSGLLFAVVVAALGLFLVWLALGRRVKVHVFAAIAAAVMVLDIGLSLDLWNESRGYIRGVPPPEEYLAPDEAVAAIKSDTTLFRVMPLNYDRSDEGVLMHHGIHSAGGQLPNPLQAYQDFIGAGQSVMFSPGNLLSPNFANLLNIKYVISPTLPEDASRYDPRSQQAIAQMRAWLSRYEPIVRGQRYSVHYNPGFLPRAFLASEYELARDKDDVIARLMSPDFDPAHTAILYEAPRPAPAPDSAATTRVVSYDCNRVVIKTSAATPQLLILGDNYHQDWKATVNGKPGVVLRAYHTLRAVPLPAGETEVVFHYDPKYYFAGALLSLAALLFTATIVVFGTIRERKKRPAAGRATQP